MNLNMALDAVNNWFWKTAGGENRPAMFDIDAVRPELRAVDRAYPQIRAEALSLVAGRAGLPKLYETDPNQYCVADATPHDWRALYLMAAEQDIAPNQARCPQTTAALKDIPGVFQVWFSILDPGKSVPAHQGPFAGYLRYHLGLVVPSERPPVLRVGDVKYTWREGESVLFDDSFEHEVYNTSDEARMVLIIDIVRPMPFPQSWVNWLVRKVIRRFYGRPVADRALAWT